jgi:hypothetical protein
MAATRFGQKTSLFPLLASVVIIFFSWSEKYIKRKEVEKILAKFFFYPRASNELAPAALFYLLHDILSYITCESKQQADNMSMYLLLLI